jgi:glutamate dehydrogenase
MQEHLIRFAEELLRLCTVTELSASWMERQRKGLRHFRHSLAAQGISGMESSRFLEMLKIVGQAGLETTQAAHLATIPEMAQTAAAIHLSYALQKPLSLCLKANQACLHWLPLSETEATLRTAGWGEEPTHELRREWLHRLSTLKSRAIRQLIQAGSRNLLAAGESLWSTHPHWSSIGELRDKLSDGELDRMGLMLLLTQLESLIDEAGH